LIGRGRKRLRGRVSVRSGVRRAAQRPDDSRGLPPFRTRPGGTAENSPALQRWVSRRSVIPIAPQGAKEEQAGIGSHVDRSAKRGSSAVPDGTSNFDLVCSSSPTAEAVGYSRSSLAGRIPTEKSNSSYPEPITRSEAVCKECVNRSADLRSVVPPTFSRHPRALGRAELCDTADRRSALQILRPRSSYFPNPSRTLIISPA